MGNVNKKKYEKEKQFLNETAFLKSPLAKTFFGEDDASENILNKSEIIETHKNDNFLGEYEDDYFDIKLIKKDFIYNLYKAENIKEHRDVSLKVYDKKKLEKGDYDYFIERIKREEEIINLCKCGNIVNIYRKIETNQYIIFEMESWDINLADYIKKYGHFRLSNFNTFGMIILGIANALKLLNKKGVMHRDIKPSNLFFLEDKSLIKLGGFDYSIYIKDNTSESVGTIFYAVW